MAQKSFSKTSEYRTYSTKGSINDKEFDNLRTELLPTKFNWQDPSLSTKPDANKEFYIEYTQEKNPAGTYNKKDLHTIEQYEFTTAGGKNGQYHVCPHADASTPKLINSTTHTTTTLSKNDLSHNIDELDTLLDDLQKDQERRLYKGGYTSDTMDTSSFDYRSAKPYKIDNSLSRVERDAEWLPSPSPKASTISREVNKEVVRNQITESRLSPVAPQPISGVVCTKCQDHTNTYVSTVPTGTPAMNKVTTTVKTYTYEVPADQDPSTLPIPGINSPNTSVTEKYHTNENEEHRTYVNTHFNTSTPIKQSPASLPPPSPQPGCQYCSHCNTRITTTNTMTVAGSPMPIRQPPPHGVDSTRITTKTTHHTTSNYPGPNQGSPYPPNNSPTYAIPIDNDPNRSGPPGSTTYKYTTTDYTTYNSTTDGPGRPGPFPTGHSPSPFPRTESPAPRVQELPKKLDELLADFPVEDYPREEGFRQRRNMNGVGNSNRNGLDNDNYNKNKKNEVAIVAPSKNVEGTAVYYPPGSETFTSREGGAYQQAGGGYMKAKGKYMYEAESSSKSKQSSSVKAVPVCLPLCCAMPCVIL